jgi:hypothetical protein
MAMRSTFVLGTFWARCDYTNGSYRHAIHHIQLPSPFAELRVVLGINQGRKKVF